MLNCPVFIFIRLPEHASLGMKPFGDGMSQEKMLQVTKLLPRSCGRFECNVLFASGGHHVARRQRGPEFPAESQGEYHSGFPRSCFAQLTHAQVSQEAKDFIKRCLARVDQRPDVLAL